MYCNVDTDADEGNMQSRDEIPATVLSLAVHAHGYKLIRNTAMLR